MFFLIDWKLLPETTLMHRQAWAACDDAVCMHLTHHTSPSLARSILRYNNKCAFYAYADGRPIRRVIIGWCHRLSQVRSSPRKKFSRRALATAFSIVVMLLPLRHHEERSTAVQFADHLLNPPWAASSSPPRPVVPQQNKGGSGMTYLKRRFQSFSLFCPSASFSRVSQSTSWSAVLMSCRPTTPYW